jgi:putative SOS response-associated peptidase YedK
MKPKPARIGCTSPRSERLSLDGGRSSTNVTHRFKSCAMVITEPNEFVAEVHDRVPVVLEKHQLDQWMNGTPDQAAELMKPAPEDALRKWPVSKRIKGACAGEEGRDTLSAEERHQPHGRAAKERRFREARH